MKVPFGFIISSLLMFIPLHAKSAQSYEKAQQAYLNYQKAYANTLQARSGCIDCFNFVAPSILGAENINPAEIGLIVYDSSSNIFRGYKQNGTWSKLSTEGVISSVSSSVTLSSTTDFILANASSASLTLTLPSATANTGKTYSIKKIDNSTNIVSMGTTSSQTIEGQAASAWVLRRQYDLLTLVSDGSNWTVLTSSVSSQSARPERVERATLTNNGSTCSIASQSGSWLSSCTRNSAGNLTLNFATGIFSSGPTCTLGSTDNTTPRHCQLQAHPTSGGAVLICARATDNVALDINVGIICMGPR